MNDNTENVFEKNILKVVEIKASDDEETWGYATGCFVDSDGTILTNKHVVMNSSTNSYYSHIFVRTATQEEFTKAEVLKISETEDLALIQVDWEKVVYFEFANNIRNGETIFSIGNPNGFGLSFTQGVISSNSRNVTYNGNTINAIQTSFVINEGNSGGPVFNKNGKLIGIISFRLKDKNGDVVQGCSFAIHMDKIKNFINAN
ncbi:MAG: trypsin-like peptidase domain-containing protein [Clostridia bacterium]|nr:trypsin-like peptidase domain-containing protein [Clostridia bacterium]